MNDGDDQESNLAAPKSKRTLPPPALAKPTVKRWYVYILYSPSKGYLYTGISTDPNRRLVQHNAGKGAKATRRGRPWQRVHTETMTTKSEALKREIAIKKLKREQKLLLCKLSA